MGTISEPLSDLIFCDQVKLKKVVPISRRVFWRDARGQNWEFHCKAQILWRFAYLRHQARISNYWSLRKNADSLPILKNELYHTFWNKRDHWMVTLKKNGGRDTRRLKGDIWVVILRGGLCAEQEEVSEMPEVEYQSICPSACLG